MRQEDLDMLRAMPVAAPAMMINGKSVMAETGETLDVVSPIDGALLTQIPNASEADVTIAVTSARRSFDSGVWSRTHPICLLYTSPSPRDKRQSRMPSSA